MLRRAGLTALLLAGLPAAAGAQAPRTLSPRLAALAARADTTALVWVIARAGADLPALADRVRAAGGQVRHISRFVNAVSAVVPSGALTRLARAHDVARVQPVAVYVRPPDETCGRPDSPACRAAAARRASAPPSVAAAVLGAGSDPLYGPGAWALQQLGTPALHLRGLHGAGVRIAMLDTGFNTLHPWMAGATVVAQHDFVYRDSVVRDQAPDSASGKIPMAHGTETWSLMAANAPGQLFGEAHLARFLLAKTEDVRSETRVEEDYWAAAVEWADSIGVDIISSSLGYRIFDTDTTRYTQLNGDSDVTSIAARAAARRGILVVVSVGNTASAPPKSLGAPADADSIVAVGATDSAGTLASFSDRGPTADGRHKPEVVAPGVLVTVASYNAAATTAQNGTSFSAPLIAGLAALVQGTRPGRPAVELRRGLLNAGSNRAAPNDDIGWGIPDAVHFLAFPSGLSATGPADSALTAASPTFAWNVEQPGPPLVLPGVDSFHLEVATDTLFAHRILDTVVTASSAMLPTVLRPGVRVWWRLGVRSPLKGSDSLPVRDSLPRQGPFVAPPWVTLLTLADPAGQSTRDSLPTLAWHAAAAAAPPGPFRYDVAVFPALAGPAAAVASATGLSDTTFHVTRPLERSLPYRWQVTVHLGTDSIIVVSRGTFVVVNDATPATTLLYQNFPNPFPNPRTGLVNTCIWFDVAQGGAVQLDVYDLRGRRVRRLAPTADVSGSLDPGHYGRPPGDVPGSCDPRFAWDGRDDTGAFVRPGVYLYRLTAPGFQDAKRIVFLGAP
jgi:serine protease AprX